VAQVEGFQACFQISGSNTLETAQTFQAVPYFLQFRLLPYEAMLQLIQVVAGVVNLFCIVGNSKSSL
jgi:hypothetical protein